MTGRYRGNTNGRKKTRFTIKKAYRQAMAEFDAAEALLFAQLTKPEPERDEALVDECVQAIDGIERELIYLRTQLEAGRRHILAATPGFAALALLAVCVCVLTSSVISRRSVDSPTYYTSADEALLSCGIEAELPTMLSSEGVSFCTASINNGGVRLEYLYNSVDGDVSENGYIIIHVSNTTENGTAGEGNYITALNSIVINTVQEDSIRNCRIAYTYNNAYYAVDTNLSLATLVKLLESVEAASV